MSKPVDLLDAGVLEGELVDAGEVGVVLPGEMDDFDDVVNAKAAAVLMLSNLGAFQTHSEIAAALGITVTTLLNWKREPDFSRELNRLNSRAIYEHRDVALRELVKKVSEGNLEAIKTHLTLTGDYKQINRNENITLMGRLESIYGERAPQTIVQQQLHLADALIETGFSVEDYARRVEELDGISSVKEEG